MLKENQVEYFLTSFRYTETKMLWLNSSIDYGWIREKVRKGLRHEIKVETENTKKRFDNNNYKSIVTGKFEDKR